MRRFILTLTFFTLPSCSYLKGFFPDSGKDEIHLNGYRYYGSQDYIDHLISLGENYLNSSGVKTLQLGQEGQKYLESIFEKITKNNELLIENPPAPRFIIIKHEVPFHFSLPQGRIFLSLGLIQKYVRHEGDLLSILTFEMIKSYRNLYNANIIIPIGFISSERLISLTRISLYDKIQINKWVFYALKRSGYDPFYILSWIQQQNKNSLDFFLHLGDVKNIAKEEYLFKFFILGKKYNNKGAKIKMNSSKEFYKFIHEIKNEEHRES